MLKKQRGPLVTFFVVAFSVFTGTSCSTDRPNTFPFTLAPSSPVIVNHVVSDDVTKKLIIDLDNPGSYANISVYTGQTLLVDHLNIPRSGKQTLNTLVQFDALGDVDLRMVSMGESLTINSVSFEDVDSLDIPIYKDISVDAGIDKVSSIKYGGPTIADIDSDGDYDFIVNNHNAETSKLYWNNGDGTVSKEDKNLSRWFMHDLHGTAAGDYDNDGDLDIVVTQGGGNGRNPSKANFYTNNNGTLVLTTGDVGIDRGGRGRGAKWSDMDLDGDLDLMLINETSLYGDKPQHFFHENLGDGTFKHRPIDKLQDMSSSRALISDINADNIDDLILYGHGNLSIWQGNGDFTFTDISNQIPAKIATLRDIMSVTDIDIDNDGDMDVYLARGKVFEHGKGEAPSADFNPLTKEFSIKPRGYAGVNEFEFSAEGSIKLHKYNYLTQGVFRGMDYPIFLGSDKSATVIAPGEELTIDPNKAQGWPQDISENGVYFGVVSDGRWKAALVRNGNIFWTFRFSLLGVNDVTLGFEPENRNIRDTLLRNDNGKFTDVSKEWNLQPGGNALGVTVGDFNNDSHQDLFVYRWGLISPRISDFMLLNTGQGHFETVTMHGASDVGGPGNGDMGQAFDFDLDGDLDLLSGSEDGEWYLYSNDQPSDGNFALVRVGYSPESKVDAISAEVIITTASNMYRKRVGSAGAIFSQSLLNIVHFGLGSQDKIERIQVRWRNGETVVFNDKSANQLFDTNLLDPQAISLSPSSAEIRKGASITLTPYIQTANANKEIEWVSSDDSILSVNVAGKVTAVGSVGQAATITAKSAINGVSDSHKFNIVNWYAKPISSVSLPAEYSEMVEGQTQTIHAKVLPEFADDSSLSWASSNAEIASVDEHGAVTAIAAGDVSIKAISNADHQISGQTALTIKPLIAPYIEIVDEEKYRSAKFVVGESITLNVNYHAGTGNKVIASDEGGIRFWLRHFKYEWIPEKDVVFSDASAIKTESGQSSMTFSLEGYTPTSELPEGQFYYLRASFASSSGDVLEQGIYPINIIAKKD